MLTANDLHAAAYSILSHDPLNPCTVTPLIEARGPSTPRDFGPEDPMQTVTFLLACGIQANAYTLEEARAEGGTPYGRIAALCEDENAVLYASWLAIADLGVSWFAAWRKAYTECGLIIDEQRM
jgi:hypothetical protein